MFEVFGMGFEGVFLFSMLVGCFEVVIGCFDYICIWMFEGVRRLFGKNCVWMSCGWKV